MRLQHSPAEQASNPIYEIITDDHHKSPAEEQIIIYEEMMTPPLVKITPEDMVTPQVELTQNPAYTIP